VKRKGDAGLVTHRFRRFGDAYRFQRPAAAVRCPTTNAATYPSATVQAPRLTKCGVTAGGVATSDSAAGDIADGAGKHDGWRRIPTHLRRLTGTHSRQID
jgi:regulator of RNase E activity RraA